MTRLIGVASLIALLIAAFGMVVLSTYNLQRLSRQIVLRKLFGARAWQIAALVGREFLLLICIAAAFGLPVAAVSINRFLATFAAPAPIGIWTLLLAVLIALAVTLFSTLRHTLIAMRLAPARILRN
jgi:ABC-type antimicrobial peptide transport system permease subunit